MGQTWVSDVIFLFLAVEVSFLEYIYLKSDCHWAESRPEWQ